MAAMSREGSAPFYKLDEDITCSICLQELSDPVSITCGHTFCKPCISSHWAPPQLLGYRCPECRRVCPKDQLIPAYRLQNMVSKVQMASKEEQTRQAAAAVQLVYTDEHAGMKLDESVVDRCFLDSEISGYPLCLICVIGEKRRGKSTLLNYILRALHNLEQGLPFSMGGEDEPLKGFEWRAGADSLTKGIWVWNKPFILKRNGDKEKLAVFVLDTEGSLEIESNSEACLKLSSLSMLLSSYLIFNVNRDLKTTEMDYLEMYLHVSELTGESFSLQQLQHLNFLVRDWNDSDNCGREAARSYIAHETEKVRRTGRNHRVLGTLCSQSVSSFLLPHPGKNFIKLNQGRLSDMDEDFRTYLTIYISNLIRAVWTHRKTNIHKQNVTCGHLGQTLKEFVSILQREHFEFTSPIEMFYFIENQKILTKTIQKFSDFVERQVPKTFSPFKILGDTPSKMRTKVSEEATRLLQEYEQSLKGISEEEKQKLVNAMKNLLDKKVKSCCDEYYDLYKKFVVGIGCAVGGGTLGLAGGIAGIAVATTVLTVEAVALVGGSVAFTAAIASGATVIGSGIGAVIGNFFAYFKKKKDQSTDNESDNNVSESPEGQQLL